MFFLPVDHPLHGSTERQRVEAAARARPAAMRLRSAEKRDELPSFHEASSTAETIPITFSTDQGGGNRRLATDQRPQSSSASRFTGNGNSSGSFAIFAAIPPRLPSSPAF
jgi:hypothetical protein